MYIRIVHDHMYYLYKFVCTIFVYKKDIYGYKKVLSRNEQYSTFAHKCMYECMCMYVRANATALETTDSPSIECGL